MKKFLAVLAAACLVFGTVACQQNDVSTGQEQTSAVSNDTIIPKVKEEETESETKLETTTAPQESELNIETLAEGEERNWSVEDVLKNDLEIDGIPISLPCTLNELLETLGDDYSVDEDEIKDDFDGEATVKNKYFTGEFLIVSLYYKGEDTYSSLLTISDPDKIDFDTINVTGFFNGIRDKGVISISGLDIGDSIDKCLEKYGKPNSANTKKITTYLVYEDKNEDCFIQINIVDNIVDEISIVDFKCEDLED